jgi:hypothetical protein
MDLKKTLGISVAALLTLALLVGWGLSRSAPAVAQTVPPAAAPDTAAGTENPALAANPGAPVVAADGKIAELTATGFTLNVPGGTLTVLVSAQTWIVVGGAAPVEGDAATLKVNMGVYVEGTRPADGQIAARVVRELGAGPTGARPTRRDQGPGQESPHPGLNADQLHGTVSAVDATSVTIALASGRTVPVQVNAATLVYKGGFVPVAALQPGDRVEIVPRLLLPAARPAAPDNAVPPNGQERAAPAPPPPGVPTAGLIWVPQANERFVRGRVEKVEGTTRLVSTPGGLLTVQLGNATAVRRLAAPDQATTPAAAADVVVNAPVLIFGTAVAGQERTLAANAVVVLPVPPAGPSRQAPLPDRRPQP